MSSGVRWVPGGRSIISSGEATRVDAPVNVYVYGRDIGGWVGGSTRWRDREGDGGRE